MIIAHRGSKGTRPENTLAAFREAVRVGTDGIELDVHLSKDGHLMVIHDETVDRTTNGHGEVQNLTLAELKVLDAGSWFTKYPIKQEIPTLKEVLTCLTENEFTGLLNIEIKTDAIHYQGIEAKLVQLMTSAKWPFDYMYSSFHFASLEMVNDLSPLTKRALITYDSKEEVAQGIDAAIIDGVHPQIDWVIKNTASLDEIEKPLRPWTVNDRLLMERCFYYELAGFHTDFPEKALRVKAEFDREG